jgi:hypothetical protein
MADESAGLLPPINNVNLSTFNAGPKLLPIDSPRSLIVVNRLGFSPRELLPVSPKKLFVKGFDNKETIKIKMDNYEEKRQQKIEMCQAEYEVCKVRAPQLPCLSCRHRPP